MYGRNGSLAYYKDGTFTKIDSGTSLTLSHSVSTDTSTVFYAFSDEQAGLLFLKQSEVTHFFTWSFDQTFSNPHFAKDMVYNKDSLFIYADRGIFLYSTNSFHQLDDNWISEASMLSRTDGFTRLFGTYTYHLDYTSYEVPNPFVTSTDFYIKLDYKDNLIVSVLSPLKIVIGERQ